MATTRMRNSNVGSRLSILKWPLASVVTVVVEVLTAAVARAVLREVAAFDVVAFLVLAVGLQRRGYGRELLLGATAGIAVITVLAALSRRVTGVEPSPRGLIVQYPGVIRLKIRQQPGG